MDTAAEEEPNTCNPLPGHSNARYRAAYQAFLAWIEDENLSPAITEDNLLAYFVHHMTSKKASPSTLWPLYSMLKSTIILHHGIDIACYQQRLPQYIKSHIAGYQPTKAKLLSKDQVNEFLSSAPDEEYLIDKVRKLYFLTIDLTQDFDFPGDHLPLSTWGYETSGDLRPKATGRGNQWGGDTRGYKQEPKS